MVSLKLELAESGLSFMLDVRARGDDFVYPNANAIALFSRFEGGSAIGLRVRSNHS
jgi:hypothetical protein